ncbi:threonine synthase [Azospirillum thermophilum]|uniref:Threonine synthase n=1 Tax=Azospirillum thermophilum TaxID=2202148 RepID=A0A2S2CVC7_9PROT|nr:threonine synthase [Azospirillum thermophilum]AWK88330.1 threonine synthase [Azospirillum thermophilum]
MAEPCRLTTDRADCVACGRPQPLPAGAAVCDCGRRENLAVRYPLDPARRAALLAAVAAGERSLWRYAPLLPVGARHASRLQVGWTPLIDCGEVEGVRLHLKDETRNPSGSLKDRASEVVVAVAAARGVERVVVASTGNAAASLACIAASAGLTAVILVPQTVPQAKLAQILAYGATVYRVAGSYDDAFALVETASERLGLFNRSTGLNPFTREGKKTVALEIAEQLGWQAPDWVIVPTGDGNILSAVWKGFRELAALGLIARTPRLVAAQSAASPAIARAHGAHPLLPPPDAAETTVADSITVDRPRDGTAALQALAESDGLAVEVDDEAIVAGVGEAAARFGLFVEPSGGAAVAAFRRLARAGLFERNQRVVCLATGSGLKDLRPILGAVTPEWLDRRAPLVRPGDWQSIAPS